MTEPISNSGNLHAVDMVNGMTYIGTSAEDKFGIGSGVEPLYQVAIYPTVKLVEDLNVPDSEDYSDILRKFYKNASDLNKLATEIPINLDHIVAHHVLQEQNPE